MLSKRGHSSLRMRLVVDNAKPELVMAALPERPWPTEVRWGESLGWFTLATMGPLGGMFAYWGATESGGEGWFPLAALVLVPVVIYGQGLLRLYTMPPPTVVRHEYWPE